MDLEPVTAGGAVPVAADPDSGSDNSDSSLAPAPSSGKRPRVSKPRSDKRKSATVDTAAGRGGGVAAAGGAGRAAGRGGGVGGTTTIKRQVKLTLESLRGGSSGGTTK